MEYVRQLTDSANCVGGVAGIRDLLSLGENAVLPLDKRIEDPVELYIGDKLIARGELRAETDLTHVTKSEPLLWIADVVAGARSDLLCGRDHATYPLLAHRVRRVVAWSV